MNPLATKTLEARVGQRGEVLQRILKRLEERDEAFAYNVPPAIRNGIDDSNLHTYLNQVYGVERFTIEDPTEVAKYAKPGHMVEKKGEHKEVTWKVATNERGLVRKIKEDTLYIDFPNGKNVAMTVNDPLLVVGTESFWHTTAGGYDDKGWSSNPRPVREVRFDLHKKAVIQYTGEPLEGINTSVPDKTIGIIAWATQDSGTGKEVHTYAVAWMDGPGVQCPFQRVYKNSDYQEIPARLFSPEDLRLLIPNRINLTELINQVRDELLREKEGGPS